MRETPAGIQASTRVSESPINTDETAISGHPWLWASIPIYWACVGYALSFRLRRGSQTGGVGHGTQGQRRHADSREARKNKCPHRGKPYWRTIERGLHLGYRRLKGKGGTWWARHYLGEQQYEIEAVGIADDLSDADGVAVLDFWQAQTKARERMVSRAHAAAGKIGPLTVRNAVTEYLDWLDSNRRSGNDARKRAEAFIYPKLGDTEVGSLTADALRKWHAGLTKEPPRKRTRKGAKQQYREFSGDDEAVRRRRASANRTLTILKAALNRAWREGKVPSDSEWRRVEPFENVDAAHPLSHGRGSKAAGQRVLFRLPAVGAGGAGDRRAIRRADPPAGARFQSRCRHRRHPPEQERQAAPCRAHGRWGGALSPACSGSQRSWFDSAKGRPRVAPRRAGSADARCVQAGEDHAAHRFPTACDTHGHRSPS